MRVSDLIDALADLKAQHGDLQVVEHAFDGIRDCQGATLEYRAVLTGRQRKPFLWNSRCKNPKGEAVLLIR